MLQRIKFFADQVLLSPAYLESVDAELAEKLQKHNAAVAAAVESVEATVAELEAIPNSVAGDVIAGAKGANADGHEVRRRKRDAIADALRRLMELASEREDLLRELAPAAYERQQAVTRKREREEAQVRRALAAAGYSRDGYAAIGADKFANETRVNAMVQTSPKMIAAKRELERALVNAAELAREVRAIDDGRVDVKNAIAVELQKYLAYEIAES